MVRGRAAWPAGARGGGVTTCGKVFPCHIRRVPHASLPLDVVVEDARRSVFAASDKGYCTKSLCDSFGLATLVRLEGILWGAALGRTRHTVPLPPLTWSMDARTLLLSEERTDTIPILHTPCHSAAPMLSLPGLAPFVELLSTSNAIRSAQGWA